MRNAILDMDGVFYSAGILLMRSNTPLTIRSQRSPRNPNAELNVIPART